MPIKLPSQLRLPSLSLQIAHFSSMSPGASFYYYRASPAFRRIFPFKLKYLWLSSHINEQPGVRRLSTRPFQHRSGSGSGSGSGFGRSKNRGDVRASKSVIEDEAELSDWVSDLRTDSFRGRLTSEDEDRDADRARNRARSRDRERNRGRGSVKRRRESEWDEFGESSGRRNRGDSFNSFSRTSRIGKRFDREQEDDDDDDVEELYSWKKGLETKRENGNANQWKGERNNLNLDSRNRRKEGKGLRREAKFTEDEEDGGDFEEGRRVMGGLGELLSEESSDVEGEEDDEDGVFRKNPSSAFQLEKDNSENSGRRSSPGKSDSYLSETR